MMLLFMVLMGQYAPDHAEPIGIATDGKLGQVGKNGCQKRYVSGPA
jgi:hypothetical protein